MRDLEFRAFDKKLNKILEVYKIDFDVGMAMLRNYDSCYARNIDEKEIQIMQFTGVLDKNDQKIFEGDIIQNSDGDKFPVEFLDGGFVSNGLPLWEIECEVVGNIYLKD